MLFYVLMCALATLAQAQNATLGPLVNIEQGWVQGSVADDGEYYTFYGIHYGGSTSGENRFKAPTPPPSYPDLFNAADRSILCAQPTSEGVAGVEDCLTLSIFTNSLTTNKPVLVWLIGEEYTNANPLANSFRRLVQEDLVVVALNYRLSIFGFLCLRVPDAPGNAGLKDVVYGLKWIKENIAQFGGNPDNVSIFGHGSGAAMVDLITMSPLADGLVHKAIAQSGSALAPWAVSRDPIANAQLFGAKIGFNGNSIQELANLFITAGVTEIANGLNEFNFLDNTVLFAPCIEDATLNPNDTFLYDTPINVLNSGSYSHIPYIAGYTDREGTIRINQAVNGEWLEKMQANFSNFLPADLELTQAQENSIRQQYFGNRIIDMNSIDDYLQYHGDTMILVHVIRGAVLRSLTSRAKVRLHEFAYLTTNNYSWPFPNITLLGAPHGIVLNFLLASDLGEYDDFVSTSLVDRYAAFASTGSPNFESAVNWFPMPGYFLQYSGGISSSGFWGFGQIVAPNPQFMKMAFWYGFYSSDFNPPPTDPDGGGDDNGDGDGEDSGNGDGDDSGNGDGDDSGNGDGDDNGNGDGDDSGDGDGDDNGDGEIDVESSSMRVASFTVVVLLSQIFSFILNLN